MSQSIRLLWNALFLSEEPYAHMLDSARPAVRGLVLVLLVGVVIAVIGLIGTTLEWATSPNLDQIQQIVLEGLQQMPWYQELEDVQEFQEQFSQYYEMSWQFLPQMFGASIGSAALQIIILPLQLAFFWLLYGLIAHLAAKILGGQGSLGMLLGTTGLAVAPQLLNLVTVLPYVTVAAIGVWTLLCRYVAVKTSHRLTTWRALVATLVPYALAVLAIMLFSCIVSAIASVIAGGMSQ